MTVEPGFGGQKYMNKCTRKIEELRKLLDEHGSEADIEVDGGVTRDNIGLILEAGANVIVTGSSVFKGDIQDNVRYFKNFFAEYEDKNR